MTGRSDRIMSAYSCKAITAATAANAKSHQPPAQTMTSTSGRPTSATSTREIRGVTTGGLSTAEAAPAAGVVVEGGAELLLAEVGPERVDEDQLRIGELPQEEVGDPQLA
jgi:hypothetical protein